MPQFRIRTAVRGRDLTVVRALCDGCDAPRVRDEHVPEPRLWLVTAGVFELRDRAGRHVMDPTTAVVLPEGLPFTIRHPAGPDTCMSLRGPLVEELAADGPRELRLSALRHAALIGAVAREDELAIAEALVGIVDEPARGGQARDRRIAQRIATAVRFGYATNASLGELAAAAGASVFHACRVFRRATGMTIAGYRREVRLRHALAQLLDGDLALAEVAAATGFATQSHLTNQFRARFQRTPGRVRAARALR